MTRIALAAAIALLAGCAGGEGEACEPFPRGTEAMYKGCADGLVCVGSRGAGSCVRPGSVADAAPPTAERVSRPEE